MQLVRDIAENSRPLALTIGNFDGMHLGHRLLVDMVIGRAQDNNWCSAVMTFEPHPLAVLTDKTVRRLAGVRYKISHLSQINTLYLLRFNKKLSACSATEFVDLLFDKLTVRYLAVGENFRFGKGRQGDVRLLQEAGAKREAEVVGVPLQKVSGVPVSSGLIRRHLQAGEFAAAAELLGRPWTLSGRVVRGRGLGRQLGFATANLRLGFVPVCEGIFAATARVGGGEYPAAVSIGGNPTVCAAGQLRTEVHVLGFSGDLYGQRLTLRFLEKLRDERKYDNLPQLQAAIADDVARVRTIFAAR